MTEANQEMSAIVEAVTSDSFIESAASLMQKATTVEKKKEVLRAIIADSKPPKKLTEEDLLVQELTKVAASEVVANKARVI